MKNNKQEIQLFVQEEIVSRVYKKEVNYILDRSIDAIDRYLDKYCWVQVVVGERITIKQFENYNNIYSIVDSSKVLYVDR